MEEALRFFVEKEIFIYAGLGGLALWYVRKFILAWYEVRGAGFGMERENAQGHLNRSAVLLVMILVMAITEFVLVSFVVPTVPGAIPLLTPTLNLLATPTTTLQPVTTPGTGEATLPAPETTPGPAIAPTIDASGCITSQLMITSPKNGDLIEEKVTISGTVDIPNFGFYQYEVARPGDPIWLTIQAGHEIKHDEALGELDARTLPAGDILLRLVATDNQGQVQATCTITIRIASPPVPE